MKIEDFTTLNEFTAVSGFMILMGLLICFEIWRTKRRGKQNKKDSDK